MGRIREVRLLCCRGWEKRKKNGRENTGKRDFQVSSESRAFSLPERSSTESEQEREAPPPGSSSKLLTANGHFVRDSSPPRVTILSRVPAIFFLCLLRFI